MTDLPRNSILLMPYEETEISLYMLMKRIEHLKNSMVCSGLRLNKVNCSIKVGFRKVKCVRSLQIRIRR